ncbi:MAG: hypothetical protein ACK4JY_10845 [Brevundimonas sp.]|uniref:hypothetical protein n=1 Tax=Brevundimonas sp. TaxID=1871086 RepID=UPI00391C6983
MTKLSIHTINARDNIMLEVMRSYFGVSSAGMHREIRGMVAQTVRLLDEKGIDYKKLQKALVPQPNRREIALIFDTLDMKESFYALPIHERLLPALHRKSSRSILHGDYIGKNQDAMFENLVEVLQPVRDVDYHHGTQFYIVYVNNLTDPMVNALTKAFDGYHPYVGCVDTTFSSPFKTHLSFTIGTSYIQHRNVIVSQHEDDAPPDENWNLPGFPFEDFGYQLRSIAGNPFGVLLTYKIERPVYQGFEEDTEFSLNALHATPLKLSDLEVHASPERFEYLQATPGHGVRQGEAQSTAELTALIKSKIVQNYLYDMTHDSDWNVSRFNVVLELGEGATRYRVRAGLMYQPEAGRIELLTLY